MPEWFSIEAVLVFLSLPIIAFLVFNTVIRLRKRLAQQQESVILPVTEVEAPVLPSAETP